MVGWELTCQAKVFKLALMRPICREDLRQVTNQSTTTRFAANNNHDLARSIKSSTRTCSSDKCLECRQDAQLGNDSHTVSDSSSMSSSPEQRIFVNAKWTGSARSERRLKNPHAWSQSELCKSDFLHCPKHMDAIHRTQHLQWRNSLRQGKLVLSHRLPCSKPPIRGVRCWVVIIE